MAEPPSAGIGEAGVSAARTYRRRAANHARAEQERVDADLAWRRRARDRYPVVGRLVVALTPPARVRPEPASVRAWGAGAAGEERVGQLLDGIEGIVAIHDRRIPGGRANIDHVVVAPAAIWVIDAKRYADAKVGRTDRGGLFRRDERLLLDGRDRTRLVDAMTWQVQAVRDAAAHALPGTVPIRPALCFVGSTWGLLTPKPFLVRGVAVCWPESLVELLGRAGPLDRAAIRRLASSLAAALPAA